jgi:hypothetical protein
MIVLGYHQSQAASSAVFIQGMGINNVSAIGMHQKER